MEGASQLYGSSLKVNSISICQEAGNWPTILTQTPEIHLSQSQIATFPTLLLSNSFNIVAMSIIIVFLLYYFIKSETKLVLAPLLYKFKPNTIPLY